MNVRCLSVALVAVLLGGTVQAHEGRVYRLVYTAPPECPDRAAFSSAVQSNSARVRHALAEEKAVTVNATVSAQDGEFEGRLDIRHPDGTETTRSVPGTSCIETVEAMALIVTLTLDPDAEKPALFEDVELDEEPDTESLPLTPYDPGYSGYTADPSIGVDAPPTGGRRSARTSERSWRFRPSASLGVTSANGPDLSPEYGVGLGLMPGSSPWSPYLVVSGYFAKSAPVVRAEGTAQFTRAVARLAACPTMAHSGVLVVRPCLFFGFGALSAMGSEASHLPAARMPWVELGTKLRGEAKLGPLIFGTEVAAAIHLVSDYFYFEPGHADVFYVPPFGASAAFDIGLQI